eukprot:gene3008-83_t
MPAEDTPMQVDAQEIPETAAAPQPDPWKYHAEQLANFQAVSDQFRANLQTVQVTAAASHPLCAGLQAVLAQHRSRPCSAHSSPEWKSAHPKADAPDDALETVLNAGKVLIIDLKAAHRAVHLATQKCEAMSESVKQEGVALSPSGRPYRAPVCSLTPLFQVRALSVNLHTLHYERGAFNAAIDKTKDCVASHLELDLAPEDTYINSCPDPEAARQKQQNNEHQFTIDRLSWELTERTRLTDEIQRLKKEKQAHMASKEEKLRFLNRLLEHLKAMQKAAKPVQDVFSLDLEMSKGMEKADLLPSHLYILYSKLHLFCASDPTCGVKIDGSRREAVAYAMDRNKWFESSQGEALATDQPLGMDEDAPASPTASASPDKSGRTDKLLSANPTPDEVFPLHIIFTVGIPTAGTLPLKFTLFPFRNFVVVSVDTKDDGNICPVSSTVPSVQPSSQCMKAVHTVGRPYRWAQWLSGFDHLFPHFHPADNATPSLQPAQSMLPQRTKIGVESLVQVLRNHVLSRQHMMSVMGSLKKDKKLPSVTPPFYMPSASSIRIKEVTVRPEIKATNDSEFPKKIMMLLDYKGRWAFTSLFTVSAGYPTQPPELRLKIHTWPEEQTAAVNAPAPAPAAASPSASPGDPSSPKKSETTSAPVAPASPSAKGDSKPAAKDKETQQKVASRHQPALTAIENEVNVEVVSACDSVAATGSHLSLRSPDLLANMVQATAHFLETFALVLDKDASASATGVLAPSQRNYAGPQAACQVAEGFLGP